MCACDKRKKYLAAANRKTKTIRFKTIGDVTNEPFRNSCCYVDISNNHLAMLY